MAEDSAYKYMLADVLYELIEEARQLSPTGDSFAEGSAFRLRATLSLMKSQATAFGLDLGYLGLADYEPGC